MRLIILFLLLVASLSVEAQVIFVSDLNKVIDISEVPENKQSTAMRLAMREISRYSNITVSYSDNGAGHFGIYETRTPATPSDTATVFVLNLLKGDLSKNADSKITTAPVKVDGRPTGDVPVAVVPSSTNVRKKDKEEGDDDSSNPAPEDIDEKIATTKKNLESGKEFYKLEKKKLQKIELKINKAHQLKVNACDRFLGNCSLYADNCGGPEPLKWLGITILFQKGYEGILSLNHTWVKGKLSKKHKRQVLAVQEAARNNQQLLVELKRLQELKNAGITPDYQVELDPETGEVNLIQIQD